MKTSELTGAALDWAVAKCEEWCDYNEDGVPYVDLDSSHMRRRYAAYTPSTDWSIGGPIIEREKISVQPFSGDKYAWKAHRWAWSAPNGMMLVQGMCVWGDTPLIAAMRCLVSSRLGDEVDVPEELAALVKAKEQS